MSRKASSKPESSNSTANLGFEAKLWLTADKLRNNMDAAEYSRAERDRLPQAARRVGAGAPVNHVVLGLIFLKYISDTFEEHRAKLLAGQGDYAGANAEDPDEPSGARQPAAGSPKGQRGGAEQYKAENVFWVPADAHRRRVHAPHSTDARPTHRQPNPIPHPRHPARHAAAEAAERGVERGGFHC